MAYRHRLLSKRKKKKKLISHEQVMEPAAPASNILIMESIIIKAFYLT